MDEPFWSCTACGGTWFRSEREYRLPSQGVTTRAPGAEPLVVETRVHVVCVECGREA